MLRGFEEAGDYQMAFKRAEEDMSELLKERESQLAAEREKFAAMEQKCAQELAMTRKETVQMEAKYQQEQKRAIDLNNHYMKIRKAINIGNGSGSGSTQRIQALAEQGRALGAKTSVRPESEFDFKKTIEERNKYKKEAAGLKRQNRELMLVNSRIDDYDFQRR